MVDTVSPQKRSAIMRQVPSRDTTPELAVRVRLHASGFRYRLHVRSLPGKPDVVLPRYRTVVFVHGCLWHWHGCKRSRMPSSNVPYWVKKIENNKARDISHNHTLELAGWHVVVIWECEVADATNRLIASLHSTMAATPSLTRRP